jgi:hypothetical protein
MRSGKAAWVMLALGLAPSPAIGDAERDEALRAIRDQAGAIQEWVQSAERPAWLDTNSHDSARSAGEALGQEQRERLREGLPTVSACRDLGQLCPPETAAAEPASSAASPPAEPTTASDERGDPRSAASVLRAEDITLTVLVSRSLGAAQLKEIFAFAADTPACGSPSAGWPRTSP